MIISKLPNVGASQISVIAKMASDFNALDLATDHLDYNCSPELVDLVAKHMHYGRNQYLPSEGLLSLREAVSRKTQEQHLYYYNPLDEVTIAAGTIQAISTAITALIRENDQVILFEPSKEFYSQVIKLNGGVPVYVKLKQPDFHIDWDELNRALTSRTKLIILNNPNSPSGSILSNEDVEKLNKFVAGSKVNIISDESFEHLVYDEVHYSVSRFPELAKRSLIVSAFGPLYHTNGWNISYVLGPADLTKEYRKIHHCLVGSVNTPMQYAYAEYLENRSEYLGVSHFFKEKRDLFCGLLENSRFKLKPSQGSYFQLLEYSKISDEKDKSFVNRLITDVGVSSVPLSLFYHDSIDQRFIRVCFARTDDFLKKAAALLCQV